VRIAVYIPPFLGKVLPSPGLIGSIVTPYFARLKVHESDVVDDTRSPLYTVVRVREDSYDRN